MTGSDFHSQIITISYRQLEDLFIGIILAAIFTLKRKGLVLWTGDNFILLTHLHIFFIWVCSMWLCFHLDDFHALQTVNVLWKNDETKEKVQVNTELKPGWDHPTNDPPRPCLPAPGNLGEVFMIRCLCNQAMQTSKNKSCEREKEHWLLWQLLCHC